MDTRILLLAGGAAAYFFYKQSKEQQKEFETRIAQMQKEHAAYMASVLKDNADLESLVNPNGSVDQAPVVFTAAVTQGGHTLNQTEVVLTCTNTSSYTVELADFQSHIWICGRKSLKCMPANIGSIKIPAKKTISFTLYAGAGIIIQDYVETKKQLNKLASGSDSSYMKNNTEIPMEDEPVIMNMHYLWVTSTGEKECPVFDIPGSYLWKSAGWTSGSVGYNAAVEKQQKKNPTHWSDTKDIEE